MRPAPSTPLFTLIISYITGTGVYVNHADELPFNHYSDVQEFYRHAISYSGDRVRRVEVRDHYGNVRAIWDQSWTDESKAAGLAS